MKNRAFSAILAGLLTLPVLASCGGGNTSASAEQTTANAVQTEAETTVKPLTLAEIRQQTADNVPALDFKGQQVVIFQRDDEAHTLFLQEFYAPEITGDIVNDTIHARNAYVEERLNVKLKSNFGPGAYSKYKEFTTMVSGAAMAGDGSMDIVPYYAYYHPQLAVQNVYLNLIDPSVKYLDFTQPWWNQTIVNNSTYNGKLYLTGGEYGITFTSLAAAIAFNIDLKNEYYPAADFYQLVRDGQWTFDTLLAYAEGCYHDLNGDGTRDKNDIYGFDGGRSDQLIHAANVQISRKDEQGNITLALNNERMVTLVDTLQPFYTQKAYANVSAQVLTISKSDLAGEWTDFFGTGHLLFSNKYIRDIVSLRDMEDDYGILPLPKLDEEQEQYKTTLADSYSTIGIMNTSKIIDCTCATLEVMCAESYRNVTLTYFESALKTKYARDESTAEMLDIIVGGVEIDFTETYAVLINAPVGKMRNVLQYTSNPFASTYAQYESTINAKIAALNEQIK